MIRIVKRGVLSLLVGDEDITTIAEKHGLNVSKQGDGYFALIGKKDLRMLAADGVSEANAKEDIHLKNVLR